jgi:alpha/beta superfamily hydrolase
MLPVMQWLAEAHFTVLAISLHAHGDSTGEINDVGWSARHDVTAAVAFLQRECPKQPVYIVGGSLGAAAAIFAAGELVGRLAPTRNGSQSHAHPSVGFVAAGRHCLGLPVQGRGPFFEVLRTPAYLKQNRSQDIGLTRHVGPQVETTYRSAWPPRSKPTGDFWISKGNESDDLRSIGV